MYILNLQMNKVSSWDSSKVKVSKDITTNQIPDTDEKKKRDLTTSELQMHRNFVLQDLSSHAFSLWLANARDLKLQQFPQVHKGSKAKPKHVTGEWIVLL